jgi:hypothetical protein
MYSLLVCLFPFVCLCFAQQNYAVSLEREGSYRGAVGFSYLHIVGGGFPNFSAWRKLNSAGQKAFIEIPTCSGMEHHL